MAIAETQESPIKTRGMIVGLCFVLLILAGYAFQQHLERKSYAHAYNLALKSDLLLELKKNNVISAALNQLASLDHDIQNTADIPPVTREKLENEVEHLSSVLLNEQQLIQSLEQRLEAYQPTQSATAFELITSAYAASNESVPTDNSVKVMMVVVAFVLLVILFLGSVYAAFFSTNNQTVSFAVDTLKIEIGFLTGLISAFFTSAVT